MNITLAFRNIMAEDGIELTPTEAEQLANRIESLVGKVEGMSYEQYLETVNINDEELHYVAKVTGMTVRELKISQALVRYIRESF